MAITDTLGISRSNQYEQRRRDYRHQSNQYNKAEDEYYLPMIRNITVIWFKAFSRTWEFEISI
jgi:hypothetical protein